MEFNDKNSYKINSCSKEIIGKKYDDLSSSLKLIIIKLYDDSTYRNLFILNRRNVLSEYNDLTKSEIDFLLNIPENKIRDLSNVNFLHIKSTVIKTAVYISTAIFLGIIILSNTRTSVAGGIRIDVQFTKLFHSDISKYTDNEIASNIEIYLKAKQYINNNYEVIIVDSKGIRNEIINCSEPYPSKNKFDKYIKYIENEK